MSIFNKLQSGSFDGLSDSEKIGKIKDILKKNGLPVRSSKARR